ncbi:hypothetical protein LAT59_03930 [Candidatus Gracilibacteria bacterium]|nr:hypothetical protein [Candidatus Gracilibacteria bacterium]
MKKIILISTLLISALLVSCSQFFEDPIAYNDSIVNIYNSATDDYNSYYTYYIETSWEFFDNIEQRRLDTIESLQQAIVDLGGIGSFKNDSTLRDGAITNLEGTVQILETYYKDLLDTYKLLENDEITEETYYAMSDEISNMIIADLQEIDSTFSQIHHAFAERHNYEILEAE